MKKIFFSSIALLSLVSCTSNEESKPAMSGEAVRFSAVIDSHTGSRAFDTFWDAGDKIGISGQSGGMLYSNVAYATKGDSNFTVVTPGEEIYYQDNNKVTFTAYYPWNDLQDGSSIATTVAAQNDQKTFDYLWAQANGSTTTAPVAFRFAHKMTKLVLTVKKGSGVSFEELKAAGLTLSGLHVEGSFDTNSGAAAGAKGADLTFANNATAANNAPIAVDQTKETVTYTLILFPQEFDAPVRILAEINRLLVQADLDFTGANTAADDENPKNAFVAGRQYNMGVTLHKTALEVEGCTIVRWTEVDGGNVDAQ